MAKPERDPRDKASRLFAEGASMAVAGVIETFHEEVKRAATWGVVGALWGVGMTAVFGGSLSEKVKKSALAGARWGAVFGWQMAPATHNRLAPAMELPRVGFTDTLIGNIVAYRAYYQRSPFKGTPSNVRLLVTQIANPITIRGIRRMWEGMMVSIAG